MSRPLAGHQKDKIETDVPVLEARIASEPQVRGPSNALPLASCHCRFRLLAICAAFDVDKGKAICADGDKVDFAGRCPHARSENSIALQSEPECGDTLGGQAGSIPALALPVLRYGRLGFVRFLLVGIVRVSTQCQPEFVDATS